MNAKFLRRVLRVGIGLSALSLLAGCAGFPGWGGWSQTPTNADMAAVIQRTEVVQAPVEPAPLAPPRRPPTTEVTFGDGK